MAFVIVLTSCQTAKRIPLTHTQSDDEYPFIDLLMSKQANELKRSSHIIVIFERIANFQSPFSKKVRALVYDAETSKKYFVKNDNPGKYEIDSLTKTTLVNRLNYLLTYYLNGKIDILKSIQTNLSNGGLMTYIYDINFKVNTTTAYKLDTVILDDEGNPSTLDERDEKRKKVKHKNK